MAQAGGGDLGPTEALSPTPPLFPGLPGGRFAPSSGRLPQALPSRLHLLPPTPAVKELSGSPESLTPPAPTPAPGPLLLAPPQSIFAARQHLFLGRSLCC
ncbi:PREDICTED: neural Wiskott-Aldrich syndrome protein-like [Chinchilla lanigera]|uniref:neural Wiskott-Aldrich syndrome protein-like n=1 Tax=Chinchilla lanigera TaxID=34839 RepID=UPI00038F1901|nr:PREDICTED: neural Wiskott-Aldrich syndrome protein-like [Chinchilla lanigera]